MNIQNLLKFAKLSDYESLIRGIFGVGAIKITVLFIQFILGVLIARLLGPAQLGIYAFCMALIQAFSIIGQFGFPVLLLKNTAQNLEKSLYSVIYSDLKTAVKIIAIFNIMIVGVMYLVLTMLKENFSPDFFHLFAIVLVIFPIYSLKATLSGILNGLGHVVYGQIASDLMRPLALLVIVVLLTVLNQELSTYNALIITFVAALIGLVCALCILISKMPENYNKIQDTNKGNNFVSLMQAGFPFLLLAGAQTLSTQTDILMLGVLVDEQEVGLYRVGVQLGSMLMTVLYVFSAVIAPQIVKYQTSNNWEKIKQISCLSHRLCFCLIFPVSVLIIIFSSELVTYIFGIAYTNSSSVLEIFVAGVIPYTFVAFSGLVLSMLGKPGIAAILTFISLCLNIVLNLILIPLFGIEGAAIATTISKVFVSAATIVYMNRVFGMDFSALGLNITKTSRSVSEKDIS